MCARVYVYGIDIIDWRDDVIKVRESEKESNNSDDDEATKARKGERERATSSCEWISIEKGNGWVDDALLAE